MALNFCSVPAFAASTSAPAILAPVASLTVPVMSPVFICASADGPPPIRRTRNVRKVTSTSMPGGNTPHLPLVSCGNCSNMSAKAKSWTCPHDSSHRWLLSTRVHSNERLSFECFSRICHLHSNNRAVNKSIDVYLLVITFDMTLAQRDVYPRESALAPLFRPIGGIRSSDNLFRVRFAWSADAKPRTRSGGTMPALQVTEGEELRP